MNIFNYLKKSNNIKSTNVDNLKYLFEMPRHVPTVVDLNGVHFNIPDGPSFYQMHDEIYNHEIFKFSCDHDSPRIIDCGANYGVSMFYFKKLYPKCHLTGIEADPSIFTILSGNISRLNCDNITLIQKAVCDGDHPICFTQDYADGGRINTSVDSEGGSITVDPIKLDAVIDGPIDFIKIDIEGAEIDALLGCKKINMVKNLFFEYHSFAGLPQRLHEVLSYLSQNGFRYYIKPIFAQHQPFVTVHQYAGFDLQLNVSCIRND